MHIVEIDHQLLDVMAVDEDGVVGRPTLTLGLDLFGRMPWGFELSFNHPSSLKVKRLIEHGIQPKQCKQQYGTQNEWEVYGNAAIYQVDNGSDFASNECIRVMEDVLKAEVRFCPPGKPKYKGALERMFKTINTKLIHCTRGTTKSNFEEKGSYDSEKEACLTLEELKKILVQYLVDIYPFEEHTGLPLGDIIPLTKYRSGLEVSGPPNVCDQNELKQVIFGLYPVERRQVTRGGIQVENIAYNSPALQPYVNDGRKHSVKLDPEDVSHCFFYDTTNSKWIEILANNYYFEMLQGKNIVYWKKMQKKMKEIAEKKAMAVTDRRVMLEAWEEIERTINEASDKKSRRDKARMTTTYPKPDTDQLVKTAEPEPDFLEDLYRMIEEEEGVY